MDRLAKIITLIFVVVGAMIFIWGSDKSFDFTDEGLYLLVYQHPQEFPDAYTSYHRVGAVVFDLVGGNIIAMRLIGFFLTALATFYFGLGLKWFLEGRKFGVPEKKGEWLMLHLALQGSVLSAYCWLPPTPNYNTMAGIGMLLSSGGVLAFFANSGSRGALLKAVTGLFAMGAGLLLAFLAKGSSAVGIALVSAILLGLCSLIGFRTKIVFAIVASSLVALGGLVLFLLMPELFKSWEFLVGSIVALTEGAGASGIIERHWHESLDFLSRHVRFYALPILMAMGAGLIARSRLFENSADKKRVAIFWSVAAVLVAEIVLIVVRDAMVAGIRGRVNGMLGYSSLFVVLLILRTGLPGFGRTIAPLPVVGFLILLVWLGILPFVTAAGTTHKIFINALLHAAPISAAAILLAVSLDRSLGRSFVLPVVGVLLTGLGFAQFASGFLIAPYRTDPKWTQTVPVEIGVPATVLKLDPATAECIEKTKSALSKAGFQPGDDILALYGLPGLVYAVGGVSPQRPWFFNDHGPIGDEENIRGLQAIPKDRIAKSIVFLTEGDARAGLQLHLCGVSFPVNYEQTGVAIMPFKNRRVEIWKTQALPHKVQ